jgi:CrcB protein
MINPTYLVGVGGVGGAILRHLVSQAVEIESFPLGTLTVNVIGSFVLAWVTFLGIGEEALLLIGTGACGSFTTFSSFSVGVVQLWEEDKRLVSVGYAAANLAGALLAIGIAWLVTHGP